MTAPPGHRISTDSTRSSFPRPKPHRQRDAVVETSHPLRCGNAFSKPAPRKLIVVPIGEMRPCSSRNEKTIQFPCSEISFRKRRSFSFVTGSPCCEVIAKSILPSPSKSAATKFRQSSSNCHPQQMRYDQIPFIRGGDPVHPKNPQTPAHISGSPSPFAKLSGRSDALAARIVAACVAAIFSGPVSRHPIIHFVAARTWPKQNTRPQPSIERLQKHPRQSSRKESS